MSIVNQIRKARTPKEISDEENLKADLARAKSELEYLAMMCDVEIPTEEEGESDE